MTDVGINTSPQHFSANMVHGLDKKIDGTLVNIYRFEMYINRLEYY